MNLENMYIDELIIIRAEARAKENWRLADKIRNFLDTKHVFVFDDIDGQLVYHRNHGTRQDLVKQLKEDERAHKMFDAWLYSVNSSIKKHKR